MTLRRVVLGGSVLALLSLPFCWACSQMRPRTLTRAELEGVKWMLYTPNTRSPVEIAKDELGPPTKIGDGWFTWVANDDSRCWALRISGDTGISIFFLDEVTCN